MSLPNHVPDPKASVGPRRCCDCSGNRHGLGLETHSATAPCRYFEGSYRDESCRTRTWRYSGAEGCFRRSPSSLVVAASFGQSAAARLLGAPSRLQPAHALETVEQLRTFQLANTQGQGLAPPAGAGQTGKIPLCVPVEEGDSGGVDEPKESDSEDAGFWQTTDDSSHGSLGTLTSALRGCGEVDPLTTTPLFGPQFRNRRCRLDFAAFPSSAGAFFTRYQSFDNVRTPGRPINSRVARSSNNNRSRIAVYNTPFASPELANFIGSVSSVLTQPFVPPVFSHLAGVLTALSVDGYTSLRISRGFREPGRVDIHGTGTFDYDVNHRTNAPGLPHSEQGYLITPFPVYAVADGVVEHRGWSPSSGNHLVIEHDNNGTVYRAVYHHLMDEAQHDIVLARRWMDYCKQGNADLFCGTLTDELEARIVAGERGLRGEAELPTYWGNPDSPIPVGIRVQRGDIVSRGQQIGIAGWTGSGAFNVHLHFGLAAPSPRLPVNGTNWWGFDPYGIYGDPSCYSGLYPTGIRGGAPSSIFAPVMPEHGIVPANVARLADDYYASRVGWAPVALALANAPCGEFTALSISYQNRPTMGTVWGRAGFDRAEFDQVIAPRADGLVPRAISFSGMSRPNVSAIYEPPTPGTTRTSSIMSNPGDLNATGIRIVEACPFWDGASWRSFFVQEDDPLDSDFRVDILSPRDLRAGLEGRVPTRIHHLSLAGTIIWFQVVHRRMRPGESVQLRLGQNARQFAESSAMLRRIRFEIICFDVVAIDGRPDSYFAAYRAGPGDPD